ncbi:MAG: hypothetical protein AB7D27_16350 [Desulfomicrobium sp.]
MSIADSCRTQWVQKLIQEKQVQYAGIIDLFQVQNVSKLYIQCSFFTDLGILIKLLVEKDLCTSKVAERLFSSGDNVFKCAVF